MMSHIVNYKSASSMRAAVRSHFDAEKYIESGNLEDAIQSLMKAQTHLRLASKALIEEVITLL